MKRCWTDIDTTLIGEEVCRICTSGLEGESTQGGCGEVAKALDGARGDGHFVIARGGTGTLCLHTTRIYIMGDRGSLLQTGHIPVFHPFDYILRQSIRAIYSSSPPPTGRAIPLRRSLRARGRP